jgi:hypothetical protein
MNKLLKIGIAYIRYCTILLTMLSDILLLVVPLKSAQVTPHRDGLRYL